MLQDIYRAAREDLLIQQGSSWKVVKNFGDVPIESFLFRGQIRTSYDDEAVLGYFCFTQLGLNRLEIALAPSVTQSLPYGKFVYDIEVYDVDETFVMRLFEGCITVTPESTRYVEPAFNPCAAQE